MHVSGSPKTHANQGPSQKLGFSCSRFARSSFFASAESKNKLGKTTPSNQPLCQVFFSENDVRRQRTKKEKEPNGCRKSLKIEFRQQETTNTRNLDESTGCTKSLKKRPRRASRRRQEHSNSTHQPSRLTRELRRSTRRASRQRQEHFESTEQLRTASRAYRVRAGSRAYHV